jgi:uncharacterized membrane protein
MANSKEAKESIASLVLGLSGAFAWLLPFLGFPCTIVGLVLGVKGIKSEQRNMAIAGVVLNIVFLFATIVNASMGAFMGVTK